MDIFSIIYHCRNRILILLGLVLFLFGCYSESGPEAAEKTPSPIQSVAPVQKISTPESTPPPMPTPATLITHGSQTCPAIALTFDACQSPEHPAGYDRELIRILTETQTPATLFLGGLWMQHHPHQTRALATQPLFELGNHAWSHPDFTTLTPEEMRQEIEQTQDLLTQLTGQEAILFRFPYGFHSEEALSIVGEQNLLPIQWDVVSGDPDPHLSPQAIVRDILAEAEQGSIIIMHMNEWGYHTAEILPILIRQLRERGFYFVTVSELLTSDCIRRQ